MDQVPEAHGLPIGHDSEIALTSTFVLTHKPSLGECTYHAARWFRL
jgi:hypothetical protein